MPLTTLTSLPITSPPHHTAPPSTCPTIQPLVFRAPDSFQRSLPGPGAGLGGPLVRSLSTSGPPHILDHKAEDTEVCRAEVTLFIPTHPLAKQFLGHCRGRTHVIWKGANELPRITQKIKCNTGTRVHTFCVLVCVFLPLSQ